MTVPEQVRDLLHQFDSGLITEHEFKMKLAIILEEDMA